MPPAPDAAAVAAARAELGWTPEFEGVLEGVLDAALAPRSAPQLLPACPGRVTRIDRGWSSLRYSRAETGPARVRNIGADVAVGDWVLASADGERVDVVLTRHSALVRRASFAGAKGESHTLAANVDVVGLLHALTSPPNPRRLERELVLAFDSGAWPVVLLTKRDAVPDPDALRAAIDTVALDVPVITVSARSGEGVEEVRALAGGHRTLALLGASGVGKSTLVNKVVGRDVQRTGAVRDGDDRGRHTTTAAELVAVPGAGWLVDTPGLRAVSLWSSGHGIERAFQDVFALTDHCRFRDCKHEDEPGCAVRAAVEAGALRVDRLESLRRLVAEEAAIEAEQRDRVRAADRRRHSKR
jgi:ribosome biogenesis GTPase / thiamine phosphate phosphatase